MSEPIKKEYHEVNEYEEGKDYDNDEDIESDASVEYDKNNEYDPNEAKMWHYLEEELEDKRTDPSEFNYLFKLFMNFVPWLNKKIHTLPWENNDEGKIILKEGEVIPQILHIPISVNQKYMEDFRKSFYDVQKALRSRAHYKFTSEEMRNIKIYIDGFDHFYKLAYCTKYDPNKHHNQNDQNDSCCEIL